LRHTTTQGTTLSDLLGKGYKYFEPRANRQKSDFPKDVSFGEKSQDPVKQFKPYETYTNASWSEIKFKSMKDLKEAEKESHT
jgi:hypothetical protein